MDQVDESCYSYQFLGDVTSNIYPGVVGQVMTLGRALSVVPSDWRIDSSVEEDSQARSILAVPIKV